MRIKVLFYEVSSRAHSLQSSNILELSLGAYGQCFLGAMQYLHPTLEDVSQEYVLIQAWKKASAYIRYHNWFSDTLELDQTTANLPTFIEELGSRLKSGRWETDPLRLVPAPKSQPWTTKGERWGPTEASAKIRPLAHVSLRDQVAATAVMLCLADRVESIQGDPQPSQDKQAARRTVSSYGNRLFCDSDGDGGLRHRWGSTKLYRQFAVDYRSFVSRPDEVAAELGEEAGSVFIVGSDLSQFYDRVRPKMLHQKLEKIRKPDDDPDFYRLASQVLDWTWHDADLPNVRRYAKAAGIEEFSSVCLPQGLVPAGFFANLALLDFDDLIRASRSLEIAPGIVLHDTCRYVDDLRLVVTTNPSVTLGDAEIGVSNWLGTILDASAPGLAVQNEKTTATDFYGNTRPPLRQSRKMAKIQAAISGGFDASRGEEIIDAVQSLVRAQDTFNKSPASSRGQLLAVPDVRDATVARFSAARFRTTYRSLRPLLRGDELVSEANSAAETLQEMRFLGTTMTRRDLDDEARNFALILVQSWIDDPANVRLLRIGLDIWPAPDVLDHVLGLLGRCLRRSGQQRLVAQYCLAELFKAGATETGFVEDSDCLPERVDLKGYRERLVNEAKRVVARPTASTPWYLKQQALLLLAVNRTELNSTWRRRALQSETDHYLKLMDFMAGNLVTVAPHDFATWAVVARRSILNKAESIQLIGRSLDDEQFGEMPLRDPAFAGELRQRSIGIDTELPDGVVRLSRWVGGARPEGPNLRNEIGVTSFMLEFIRQLATQPAPEVVTPACIAMTLSDDASHTKVIGLRFVEAQGEEEFVRTLYRPPSWCGPKDRWRFQLGYLVRFILTGTLDFTEVPKSSWREDLDIYRAVKSHWYQRSYGLHNGHEGFGDDGLPISETTEDVLYAMLAWPGCRSTNAEWLDLPYVSIEAFFLQRLAEAEAAVGEATQTLMLPVIAPLLAEPGAERPLRGCVVQTITPEASDFHELDLEHSAAAARLKHRNHLSTALAAVKKMLELRETHKKQDSRLDWLILPELAVHPRDVRTHLIPFARAHKTIILTGLTYERLVAGGPLVNSAIWVLPQNVPGRGLQVKIRRQGKYHLAKLEVPWETKGLVKGFRPAQWLVGYRWDPSPESDPLWLTAAICYDATDLRLASDLRDRSDVFAIPALNQDVGTFDQMAAALHYHMYQLVIVANNGGFGGSNAHIPRKESHIKQVFHNHGQPQASISFFEIDNIPDMKKRHELGKVGLPSAPAGFTWKYPPAGFRN